MPEWERDVVTGDPRVELTEGEGDRNMAGCLACHEHSFLAAVCRRYAIVSREKRWSTSRFNSEGRSGWTYSDDIKREASILSESGPLMDVIMYGAVSEDILGNVTQARLKSCLVDRLSSSEMRSDFARRGTTLVISDRCCITSQSSRRVSNKVSLAYKHNVPHTL